MRYSIEPRDRIYVKGYGFLSFAKNMGKATDDWIGNKIADKMRCFKKKKIRKRIIK